MRNFLLFALVSSCGISMLGCGGAESIKRVAISGSVTLKGEPLAEGTINLVPDASTKGPMVYLMVKDGKFSMDETNGPVAGTYTAEISVGGDEGAAEEEEGRSGPVQAAPKASSAKELALPETFQASVLVPDSDKATLSITFD